MAYTVVNPGAITGSVTAATITVPNGGYSTTGSVNLGASNTTAGAYWAASPTGTLTNPSVNIDSDGISMRNDTDIKIGDVSLKQFINDVSQRLAIMVPNPKLEADFEQLKELRDQYHALERELTEKARMWDTLKKE